MVDGSAGSAPGQGLRDRLRAALPEALKARDAVAVAALRSALAAVDNAEAVDPAEAPAPDPAPGQAHLAARVAGLGAAEVPRRQLGSTEVADILRAEVTSREGAALHYERAGHPHRAHRLRAEAAVIDSFLG